MAPEIGIAVPSSHASARLHVESIIHYHAPIDHLGGKVAILDQDEPHNTSLMLEPHRVKIFNARIGSRPASLETTGFQLARHSTKVADFHDRQQVRDIYYPEIAELVKAVTGAQDVLVFGEVLRSESAGVRDRTSFIGPGERRDRSRQGISGSAHVDYDRESTKNYVIDIAGPSEAAALLRRPFKLINIWRGLAPVDRSPLAVVDASTVSTDDLIPWEIRHPIGPKLVDVRMGWQLAFNPAHRWYYFPRMMPGEALIFKLCDSDQARPQYTAHTAFEDPCSPPDADPRVSFEIRTIAFSARTA